MRVVVAKGQQFFMTLLQRLEPCQAFVDRDVSHASAFIPMPIASEDDDAIVAEGLSMVSGQSAEVTVQGTVQLEAIGVPSDE